ESKKGCKRFPGSEQRLRNLISQFGRRRFSLQLAHKAVIDVNAQRQSRGTDRLPPYGCVRTERLSLDERDLPVSELCKMFHRQRRCARMIEDDVSHSGYIAVSGNRDKRNLGSAGDRRIDGDQPFHSSLLQEQGIFFDEFIAVTVAHHKVKIAFLQKVILYPGH